MATRNTTVSNDDTRQKAEARRKAKNRAFTSIVNKINKDTKHYGEMAAVRLSDNTSMNVQRESTGSLALDYVIGGGVPNGRICEFFGPEGSGKTSAALQTIANVQRDGGNAVFIDVEHALDPMQARRLGVDVDKLIVCQPNNAEQALDIMEAFISSGGTDIIVLDSIASLVPQKELEGSMEDNTVAVVARLMSRALRKITGPTSDTGTKVIFINQVREKIGVMFGNPETTPGGRALKFYASLRVRISRTKQIKVKDNAIGQEVIIRCVKNKVSTPFRSAKTKFYWDHGFDIADDIITLGKDAKVLTYQGGVKNALTGEPVMVNGEKIKSQDQFREVLNNNVDGIRDKYYKIVYDGLERKQYEEMYGHPEDEDGNESNSPAPDDVDTELDENKESIEDTINDDNEPDSDTADDGGNED